MEMLDSKSKFKKLTEVLKEITIFDLIEIQRPSGKCSMHPYCHWAIYNGDGDVVHLRPVNACKISGTPCACCFGSNDSDEEEDEQKGGQVLLENIKNVVGDHNCRINNLTREAAKRGILELDTLVIEENIRIALENKFRDYSCGRKNCEYFVTSLKYTEGFSAQADCREASRKVKKFVTRRCDVV